MLLFVKLNINQIEVHECVALAAGVFFCCVMALLRCFLISSKGLNENEWRCLADHTREGAVQTSERLFMAEQKVSESYQTVKCALIKLHERYEASKAERNIVHRYALFKVGALFPIAEPP